MGGWIRLDANLRLLHDFVDYIDWIYWIYWRSEKVPVSQSVSQSLTTWNHKMPVHLKKIFPTIFTPVWQLFSKFEVNVNVNNRTGSNIWSPPLHEWPFVLCETCLCWMTFIIFPTMPLWHEKLFVVIAPTSVFVALGFPRCIETWKTWFRMQIYLCICFVDLYSSYQGNVDFLPIFVFVH